MSSSADSETKNGEIHDILETVIIGLVEIYPR